MGRLILPVFPPAGGGGTSVLCFRDVAVSPYNWTTDPWGNPYQYIPRTGVRYSESREYYDWLIPQEASSWEGYTIFVNVEMDDNIRLSMNSGSTTPPGYLYFDFLQIPVINM